MQKSLSLVTIKSKLIEKGGEYQIFRQQLLLSLSVSGSSSLIQVFSRFLSKESKSEFKKMMSSSNSSSRAGTSNLSRRHLLSRPNNRMEIQESCSAAARGRTNRSESSRQKKLALQKDVDKLKQKLRHEESIHRALERAFNRPLGALPRLPPYLPQHTLELLAEIAVLEEEVVRLEEQVVNYRQDLYQEAVYVSSKRKVEDENPVESTQHQDKFNNSKCKASKQDKQSATKQRKDCSSSTATTNNSVSLETFLWGKSPSLLIPSDQHIHETPEPAPSNPTLIKKQHPLSKETNGNSEEARAKENQTTQCINQASKIDQQSPAGKKQLSRVKTPVKKPSMKRESTQKCQNQEPQAETIRQVDQQKGHKNSLKPSGNRVLGGDSEPNKISEDILKLLCSIFKRLSTTEKAAPQLLTLPPSIALASRDQDTEPEFEDPYGSGTEPKEWDIGAYNHLCAINAKTMDLKKKRNALFLLHKLKLLLRKLAAVNLDGLTHQHKLAFWINTYNACMMNAFLEHGVPETSEMVVVLMCEASIVVGGQLLNALTIEHFILRLPFYQKFAGPKGENNDELRARSMFGLEWSEPLVTFALSCGSWSSPAVRVYTASQVESELEAAKRDYLRAAIGINKSNNKLLIPKILDWYLLDFAKDLESLLDWVCLQLPDELRKLALQIVENKGKQEISQFVEVIPYDFSFRYLLHR